MLISVIKRYFLSSGGQGLSAEKSQLLIDKAPAWGYWLTKLRSATPYTLSEQEEQLNNIKNVNGRQALVQLYSSITNRYEFELTVDGETKTLTREGLSAYFRHADPAVREQAYRTLLDKYAVDEPILGQIYQALARDWYSENVELRQYDSAVHGPQQSQ